MTNEQSSTAITRWNGGRVLGAFIDRSHECDPGRDAVTGLYEANGTGPGTVWQCDCGALWVKDAQERFRPATRAQKKAIERGEIERAYVKNGTEVPIANGSSRAGGESDG